MASRIAVKEGTSKRLPKIQNSTLHCAARLACCLVVLGTIAGCGSNEASKQFKNGCTFIERGEWDTAIDCFTDAIELDPQMKAAYMRRGDAYRATGCIKEAVDDYTKCTRLDPKDGAAYVKRGLIRAESNEFREAIKDFDRCVALYETEFEQLRVVEETTLTPDAGRRHSILVEAYLYRGHANSRLYLRNRALENQDKAVEDFGHVVRLSPNDARAYLLRGQVWLFKQDFDAAVADFDQAIGLRSDFPKAFLNRAVAQFSRHEFAKVIEDCTNAIELDSDSSPAYLWRAKAHFMVAFSEGEYTATAKEALGKAIADCTEVIRLNPDSGEAYSQRGDAYFMRGMWDESIADWDESIADYSEAIRLNPGDADAYGGRAGAYEKKGDKKRAAADQKKAKSLRSIARKR